MEDCSPPGWAGGATPLGGAGGEAGAAEEAAARGDGGSGGCPLRAAGCGGCGDGSSGGGGGGSVDGGARVNGRGKKGRAGGGSSGAPAGGGSPGRTLQDATAYRSRLRDLSRFLQLPPSASAPAPRSPRRRAAASADAPAGAAASLLTPPPPEPPGAATIMAVFTRLSALPSPSPPITPRSPPLLPTPNPSTAEGAVELSPLTSISTPMVTARTSPVPSPGVSGAGPLLPPSPAGSAPLLFFPSLTATARRRARRRRAAVVVTLCAALSTLGGLLLLSSFVLPPAAPAAPAAADGRRGVAGPPPPPAGGDRVGDPRGGDEVLTEERSALEVEAAKPAYIHPTVPLPVPTIPLDRLDEGGVNHVSVHPSADALRSTWESHVAGRGEGGESLESFVFRVAGRPRNILTLRMGAVTPRPLLPGSFKGVPYRVRVIDPPHDSGSSLRRVLRRTLLATGAAGGGGGAAARPTATRTVVDLHGGIVGVGEYYTIVRLGGKAMRVQVDTGSATLAVPMRGCKSCVNEKHGYSVAESPLADAAAVKCAAAACQASRCTPRCKMCGANGACCSTLRPDECGFFLRYADGSAASGSLVSDELRWGNLSTRVTFGGILKNSPDFERYDVDGILGMAYKSLACNPTCVDPPFDLLVASGRVDDVFSICMTAHGGKLVLGGMDERLVQSPVQWAPLFLSEPARYYRVQLGGSLKIGGKDVALPNFRHAIVDTGTTLIVTSKRTFDAIRQHLQTAYCHVPELCAEDSWFATGSCVVLSEGDLAKLPDLTFRISGAVDLTLRPHDYMLEYRRGFKSYRCVGIMGMDGLGGMVVLGNTLNQRYVAVYDRMNSRIGFGEARPNCGMRAGKNGG